MHATILPRLLVMTLVGAWGCGDDSGSRCIPGETRACLGADRCEGVQRCREDGRSYDPCECALPDAAVDASEGSADAAVDGGAAPVIVLDELKAFPSAFGAGRDLTGGRGGVILPVTTLADAGPGSFREAVMTPGPRTIIILVEGRVDAESPLYAGSPAHGDCTIWGQLAPGRGLTWSGDRFEFRDNTNVVIRHLTSQIRDPAHAGTWDALIIDEPAPGGGFYLDHNSFRYGMDEAFGVYSREADNRSTIAYNLAAESIEGHNTGIIVGNSAALYDSGDFTFARNMFYNISHRFPNVGAGNDALVEIYNNYIVNWQQRLTRVNGQPRIDYFANVAQAGNHRFGSTHPINKWVHAPEHTSFRVFCSGNFVSEWAESPGPDQRELWVYRNDVPSLGVAEHDRLADEHFASERQGTYDLPPDGVWEAAEVAERLLETVGHNRGVDADGRPGFYRDDLDASYVDKSRSGATETDYRTSSEWNDATFTGTAAYSDRDGDFMPDYFEALHPHLDPDVADGAETHVDWDFGTYRVVNDAGYSNLEICAEYYADGFSPMIRGLADRD